MRLYRALRWYRALGRPENNLHLPWRGRWRVAWYWASDKAAYDAARRWGQGE